MVVPKACPSGWRVTAAGAGGFTKLNTTSFNPYLARGFGDHGRSLFFVHLSSVLSSCAVSVENLAGTSHVDPEGIQPILSGVKRKKAEDAVQEAVA